MSRQIQPREHETVLRGMDAATAPRTRSAHDLPADARAELDRILATPRDGAPATPGLEPRPTRPTHSTRAARSTSGRVRKVLLAAAAVLLLAVGLAVPVVTAPAYAGWQQTPEAVDLAGTEKAADECRQMWTDVGIDPAEPGFVAPAQLRSVLSERRGPYTFTVMRGPRGQFADCMIDSWWAGGGGGGAMTPLLPTPPPARSAIDTVTAGAVGPSRRTIFGITMPGDPQSRSYMYGRAGTEVTAVVLHTRSQGDVSASVQNGVWAAWWPSPGEVPEIGGVQATVTTRDGSSRAVDLDSLSQPWPGKE